MHLYFVGGIHGSGKTTLCKRLAASLDVSHYSAGELIRLSGVDQKEREKSVRDVDLNQSLLVQALDRIRGTDVKPALLDGHFTVIDTKGHICKIGVEVFRRMRPAALVLVDAEPVVIASRLRERDGAVCDLDLITAHARAEKSHAVFVSTSLQIPLYQTSDIDDADSSARWLLSLHVTAQGT